MSIIFPNESEMDIENLIIFKKDLTELLYNDSYSVNELNKIRTIIRRLEGYLLMADKKNLFIYFNAFYEVGLLNILNGYLDKRDQQISFCILECIYILLTNIQNTGLIFYLYSTKYATQIPGEYLNIIDKIISIDIRKKEEFLTYQVNFIKSLTLKLNIDCIEFFYNKHKNQFPILHRAFSLYNHKDAMIRSAVKNIFLTILKIKEEHLRRFITSFPNNIYYPNIIFQLRNIIIRLCIINFIDEKNRSNPIDKFRDEHDNLIDYMYYISDILLLNIDNVNFILINCILNEIILPLFKTIISKKEEKISIVFALYILTLFIFIVKNKFIIDVISYFLFEEMISKNLMEKLEEFEFKAINQNLMSCIDFLIVNNKIADVNDQQWKTIKNYMSDICGIDLSTGFIVKENIYDIIKKNIYEKNRDILIKNEIFGTINMLLTAKDDSILLILNLLFYCEISFYKEKNKTDVNDININSNNINNNDMLKNKYDKDNQIIDINSIENYNNSNIENNKNIDSNKNNINNINDDIIQKIQDELIDDEEKKNNNNKGLNENKDHMEINMNLDEINNYNILNKNFFQLDLTNSKNLFNFLLKLLLIPRNLRSITNEIILFNISILLNLNKNREKKEFIIKIQEIFKNEITKLRNILNQDKSLKSLTYITSVKALEQYINPMDKKIKDLISSPFILIPLIYLDEQEDVPQNFKEIKFNYQILNAYIMKILILYDMLNDLFNCQYDMIIETKKNPFELPKQADFLVGKEYFNLDLGKENILCELIINKKIIKAVIFFDFQNVYFGQIMTNSYKNLSKIKLVKKYNLRNIEVKIPNSNESFENENTLLEIYDGTQEKNNILGQSNRLVINCFEVEKTVIVYKQLKKEKNNAIQLEFSLFDSFLDAIEKKFSLM
jgi:hypothetical protein